MPFNMNKLTEKAQEAVLAAQELAQNQPAQPNRT